MGKHKEAEGYYRDGLAHLETVKNDNNDLKKLRIIILQNLSNCCLRSNDFREVINNCSKALKVDENAVKALFFRSQGYLKTH